MRFFFNVGIVLIDSFVIGNVNVSVLPLVQIRNHTGQSYTIKSTPFQYINRMTYNIVYCRVVALPRESHKNIDIISQVTLTDTNTPNTFHIQYKTKGNVMQTRNATIICDCVSEYLAGYKLYLPQVCSFNKWIYSPTDQQPIRRQNRAR